MASLHHIRLSDDGVLVVNGVHMPGVVDSVSINGQMILQEQTLLLTSGKEKTFNGYDDAVIKVYLTLTEGTDGDYDRYSKLKILNSAFKRLRNEQPVIYSLEGRVFSSMDIRGGLFKSLSVDVDNTDSLAVSINFVEGQPTVALAQKQQQAATSPVIDTTPASPGMSAADKFRLERLEKDYHGN